MAGEENAKEGSEKQEMNAVAKELEAISLAGKEKASTDVEFTKDYYDEKLKLKDANDGYKEVKPVPKDDIAYAEKFFSDQNKGNKMAKGDVTSWEDSDGTTKTSYILVKTADAPAIYRESKK